MINISKYKLFKILKKLFIILLFLFNFSCTNNDTELQIIAFPNPFHIENSPLTIIPCDLDELNENDEACVGNTFPNTSLVSFTIYNIKMNKIYESPQKTGELQWSGYTNNGNKVPAGMYFITVIEEDKNNSSFIKRASTELLIQ